MNPDEQTGFPDIPIVAATMPNEIFKMIWFGLLAIENKFGNDTALEDAHDWLDFTMQGRAIGDYGDEELNQHYAERKARLSL